MSKVQLLSVAVPDPTSRTILAHGVPSSARFAAHRTDGLEG